LFSAAFVLVPSLFVIYRFQCENFWHWRKSYFFQVAGFSTLCGFDGHATSATDFDSEILLNKTLHAKNHHNIRNLIKDFCEQDEYI